MVDAETFRISGECVAFACPSGKYLSWCCSKAGELSRAIIGITGRMSWSWRHDACPIANSATLCPNLKFEVVVAAFTAHTVEKRGK